jgi:excisionase family DNA binding protein
MTELPREFKDKDFLTTTEAAKLLSVSPDTVLKWVKAGKVKSHRTLGGHFRIPVSELDIPAKTHVDESTAAVIDPDAISHQYCWEYLADGDEIKSECKECITYRSRARRCYELKDLPGSMGCLNLFCDNECKNCEYYKVVSGQGINVLLLSKNRNLITDLGAADGSNGIRFEFAESEYDAAVLIQSFRPDYVVVDCAMGRRRTGEVCASLFSDIRIPVARVILCSRRGLTQDYCDQEAFGWIRKPFTLSELRHCIRGVPKMMKDK